MDVPTNPEVLLVVFMPAVARWSTLALVAGVGVLVLLASRRGLLGTAVGYRVGSATIVLSAFPALIVGVRDASTPLIAAAVLIAATALASARPARSVPPSEDRRSVMTPGTRAGRPWRRDPPRL